MSEGQSNLERELHYLRREFSRLGGDLLRLQEEQSQSFREARRSRTVVKLLREAYRLGDVATSSNDIGGPMLELVVDNALCDRAALLREEPIGTGRFLLSHAIGLPESALASVVRIDDPPDFLHTSTREPAEGSGLQVTEVLGMPFVLWAYDRGSGHAMIIGNRSETNVSRPFEAGDQEMIEGALSIYLDVLHRKVAEAQLRQAKQAAEAAIGARAAAFTELAEEIREPLAALVERCDVLGARSRFDTNGAEAARDVRDLAGAIAAILARAAEQPGEQAVPLSLEMAWISAEDVVRGALRTTYAACLKRGIEVHARMPRRPAAILADRLHMQQVVQHLIMTVLRSTLSGGSVRVESSRRSDGGLEILVNTRGPGPLSMVAPPGEADLQVADDATLGLPSGLALARRTVEGHGGTLTFEVTSLGTAAAYGAGGRRGGAPSAITQDLGGTHPCLQARLLLPARATRDVDLAGRWSA